MTAGERLDAIERRVARIERLLSRLTVQLGDLIGLLIRKEERRRAK